MPRGKSSGISAEYSDGTEKLRWCRRHRCRQLKAAHQSLEWLVTEVYVVQSRAPATLHESRIASRIMGCVMDISAAAEMVCGGGWALDDVAGGFVRLQLRV